MTEHERFSHLRLCLEPDYGALGSSKAAATQGLIQLAGRLGCRDKPCVLPAHDAVWLARGAADILAAIEHAGGVRAFSEADLGSALHLAYSLTQAVSDPHRRWLPSGMRSCVEDAFAALGPLVLALGVAAVHEGAPGCLPLAFAAGQLTHAFLLRGNFAEGWYDQLDSRLLGVKATAGLKMTPTWCLELLQACATGISEWSAAVGRAIKQQQRQQQLNDSMQPPAQLPVEFNELHKSSIWLPLAAGSLLRCMQKQEWHEQVNERQLLATLGHLVQQVVAFMHLNECAAAAGLWPSESSLPAATCIGQLHRVVMLMSPTQGVFELLAVEGNTYQATRAAAGWPGLHATVRRSLCTAVDQLAAPRHTSLLLYLSLLLLCTRLGETYDEDTRTLLTQLARVQQLAINWSSAPQQEHNKIPESLPAIVEVLPHNDQLAFLMDINLVNLHKAMKVAPFKNMRGFDASLLMDMHENCLAPGLFAAGRILEDASNVACAAADARAPWPVDGVLALLHGALGCLRLAHEEAAAREALPAAERTLVFPDRPAKARRWGANILASVTHILTPPMVRTLAKRGLAGPLLQAVPWRATSSEPSPDHVTPWEVTVCATRGVCWILAELFEDAPARAAAQRDGSLSAAVQRVRDLQPPPEFAAGWPAEREALLEQLPSVPAAGDRGGHRRRAGAGAAAAEPRAPPGAEAVAAAERAMQELLAEEQSNEASSQRSKAATKRARKKAAKVQAAAATQGAQAADHTAASSSASTAEDQVAESKAVAAAVPPVAAAAVPQSAGCPIPDNKGVGSVPAQQVSATPAESDYWWRCPLSGKVMRDPVLCGSEGHSFERETLEQWLAANPGVHPLSRQQLKPGEGSVVPNHALRNMIQQLQLK